MVRMSRVPRLWWLAIAVACFFVSYPAFPVTADSMFASFQVDAACVRKDGAVEIQLESGTATYHRSSTLGQVTCESAMSPGQSLPAAGYDSVDVEEDARVRVLHDTAPDITLFGNSSVTLVSALAAEGQGYPQLHLGYGTMAVGTLADQSTKTPTPAQETVATPPASPEVVAVTAILTLKSVDAGYLLYAGEDGVTWVAVKTGIVQAATSEGVVDVPTGWQLWTAPGSVSLTPLPATRSVIDVVFGEDLPHVPQLTGGYLRDDDVFATCNVAAAAGTDIHVAPGAGQRVASTAPSGTIFAASYQLEGTTWLWGTGPTGVTGWANAQDIRCPYDASLLPLSDDADADAVADHIDNCWLYNPNQADRDLDGFGDECDPEVQPEFTPTPAFSDIDGDGSPDDADNCVDVYNPDQIDRDLDGVGEECDEEDDGPTTDTDTDEDGLTDDIDNCPFVSNPNQEDRDEDLIGDACDAQPTQEAAPESDSDSDTWPDNIDNCTSVYNPDQSDLDGDGIGDACDIIPTQVPLASDSDGDTWPDDVDNCPFAFNPDQGDLDIDGVGDACDDPLAMTEQRIE